MYDSLEDYVVNRFNKAWKNNEYGLKDYQKKFDDMCDTVDLFCECETDSQKLIKDFFNVNQSEAIRLGTEDGQLNNYYSIKKTAYGNYSEDVLTYILKEAFYKITFDCVLCKLLDIIESK